MGGGESEIGGCEILGELGSGGMGVVYRAQQREPRREVALKLLQGPSASSPAARERFRVEAAAMARLEHPGILPVYAYGEQDGVPYFTMKLAEDGSLREHRDDYSGEWRKIAELVAGIADAVQFAHERGVLHRDLKPANVLFDNTGRAHVADFGLAKVAGEDSGLTLSQAMLGTPNYLAPETAEGGTIAATTASDVWALGAMLYELLAQKTAFDAPSVPGVMLKIIESEPEPLAAKVPRDLGVITAKALSKDPARRYRSAMELAGDLRNWLEGRAILARPASSGERLVVWTRKNPALAGTLVVLAAVLVVFSAAQWAANRRLAESLAETRLREVRLLRASGNVGQRFDSLATLADLAQKVLRERRAELRTQAAAALALPDLRETERWRVPVLNAMGVEKFSADLSRFAAAREGGGIALYDLATRRPVREWTDVDAPRVQDFSVGGEWLGVRFADQHWDLLGPAGSKARRFGTQVALHPAGGFVTVRDGALVMDEPGAETRVLFRGSLYAEPLLLSPDGVSAMVFAGEETSAFVVRIADGEKLTTLASAPHRVTASDWSRDGRFIAIAEGEPPFAVRVFDAVTGAERAVFTDHQMPVRKLSFHANGESLATASDDQSLVWREIEPGGSRIKMPAGERALRFGSDGKRLGFSPGDGELGILEAALPAVFRAWPEPQRDRSGAAYSAALSPDGRWLATMHDKSLRIWDAAARRETAREPFEADRVWWGTVFFSPKDSAALVWSPLGVGVWSARIGQDGKLADARALGGSRDAMVQQFAADGRSLVVGERRGDESTAWLWPDGDPARTTLLAGGARFNGFRILPGSETGISTHFAEPDLWLWSGGKRLRSLGIAEPTASEPSADGRWLLTGTRSESILWDTKTWTPAARWPARPGERDAWAPAFSPDSRTLAQAAPNGLVTLRAVPSGGEILTLTPPRSIRVQQLLFTPGGALLLVGGDGRVFEWDLAGVRRECAAMGLGW